MRVFIGRKCTTSPFKAMCAPNTKRVSRELQSEIHDRQGNASAKLRITVVYKSSSSRGVRVKTSASCTPPPAQISVTNWYEEEVSNLNTRQHCPSRVKGGSLMNADMNAGKSFSPKSSRSADSYFLHSGRRAERTDH